MKLINIWLTKQERKAVAWSLFVLAVIACVVLIAKADDVEYHADVTGLTPDGAAVDSCDTPTISSRSLTKKEFIEWIDPESYYYVGELYGPGDEPPTPIGYFCDTAIISGTVWVPDNPVYDSMVVANGWLVVRHGEHVDFCDTTYKRVVVFKPDAAFYKWWHDSVKESGLR